MTVIGVDFGTTNSVVTRLRPDGSVETVRHAFGVAEMDVIRSVLCFWNDGAKDRVVLRNAVGPAAIEAYLDDPLESRLMMSLKSYLAQRSFTDTRVFGRPFTLEGLIGLFLGAILPAPNGGVLVAGRPVRFAGDSPDDAFGEERLRGAYAAAGWADIQTALEPEAAGYRFARGLAAPATVLIGDFGGGTSDFSVMRFEPGSNRPVTALGHAGVGIAGDTFDYRIVDHVVSPRLGKGTTYRPGGTDLPVPPEYFSSFARWHRLSLMRAPKTMRDIEAVARSAMYPDRLHALLRLIRDELGYELYRTVSGREGGAVAGRNGGAAVPPRRFRDRGDDRPSGLRGLDRARYWPDRGDGGFGAGGGRVAGGCDRPRVPDRRNVAGSRRARAVHRPVWRRTGDGRGRVRVGGGGAGTDRAGPAGDCAD